MKSTVKVTISPVVERHKDNFFALIYSESIATRNVRRSGMSSIGAFATVRAARKVLQQSLPAYVRRQRDEYADDQVSLTIDPICMNPKK